MATSAPASFAFRGRQLDVDGRRAFFREAMPASGARESLLLLHGWIGTSSWMFRHLFPELSRRYRTIAPDLPGFGRTQTLAEAPSIDRYTEFLRKLAESGLAASPGVTPAAAEPM